jgi:(S)-ureidoglycine-glyoxylate aminotransferase
LLNEGQDAVIQRHQLAGDAMLKGVLAMGLKPFGDLKHKMTNVVGVHIPEHVDGEQIRHDLLNIFNIEIGTSFGPLKGKVWRIGTMGYNARQDAVLHTLQSLETVLRRAGFALPAGAAVDAAMSVYAGEK